MVLDDIRDAINRATSRADEELAERTGKEQVGFDPDVCVGCVHRGEGTLKRCGLCGCPTIENFPLDQRGMVPEGCPRKLEHQRSAGERWD